MALEGRRHRLLTLTGCRRGEVLTLRWRNIGADTIHLADGKTGPRACGSARLPVRCSMRCPPPANADESLFPYYATNRARQGRPLYRWHAICADARIGRARLQDLRHTVASHAVMPGENLPLAGKLLGHIRHATTAGYGHLADDHLMAAAERVGNAIAEAMALRVPHTMADRAGDTELAPNSNRFE